jgi:tetratricopeptide (TPR) repeat protein
MGIDLNFEKLFSENGSEKIYTTILANKNKLLKNLEDDFFLLIVQSRMIFALGQLFNQNGDPKSAACCFCSIIRRWPTLSIPRYQYARALSLCGDQTAANHELKRALVLGGLPLDAPQVGRYLAGQPKDIVVDSYGRPKWVAALFRIADRNPAQLLVEEIDNILGRTPWCKLFDRMEESSVEFEQFVDNEFNLALIQSGIILEIGLNFSRHHNYKMSYYCFEILTKRDPLNDQYRHELAIAYSLENKINQSKIEFQRALVLEPNRSSSAKNLGAILTHTGHLSESRRQYKSILAMCPDHIIAQRALGELDLLESVQKPKGRKLKIGRWPRRIDEFGPFRQAITKFVTSDVHKEIILRPGAKVFTMGSCFAQNMAETLSEKYKNIIVSFLYADEDINNTYAGLYLIDVLVNPSSRHRQIVEAYFKAEYIELVRDFLRTTDVVIYTMGVAPGFFDPNTKDYVIPRTRGLGTHELARSFEFRTTSVKENVDNVVNIINGLTTFNPKMRVVLTVSPVPLAASLEYSAPLVADCISKSTLRVAAHEVLQKLHPRVVYWPSFEIVRWLGPQYGSILGTDDGDPRHVSSKIIEEIMDAFISHFGSPDF